MKPRMIGVFLALLAGAGPARSNGDETKPKPKAEPEATPARNQGPVLPGFAYVPAGTVLPGCTLKNFQDRAQDAVLKAALIYDVWGQLGPLELPAYWIGRYEVTNAQWKLYLDRNFRREHVTSGEETLKDIALKYVKFRGEGVDSEWQAVYAFNYEQIVEALVKENLWQNGWSEVMPGLPGQPGVETMVLPKGIKLVLYAHQTPKHWYGWCKLSGLSVGREYCDIRKPPEEAFVVPTEGIFKEHVKPTRDKDFARYPVRDVCAVDVLAFAEWAGCHLPSEYEWERAGRGERPNEDQHPFPGKWDRQKQVDYFAWTNNQLCWRGPLPVDDPRVEKGDSAEFGLRHMLGNIWELTRTFYDAHPFVVPRPPPDDRGLFNYALTTKGASWGDGWVLMQLSARTGQVGNAAFDLKYQNRADSVGFRLVRHERPGHDLLLHSLLKLAYNRGRGMWASPLPHAYSIPRMAGVDRVHITESEAPYLHVKEKATGIAFAPLWFSDLNEKRCRNARAAWTRGKATGRQFDILGILKCDVPFRAGVRYTQAEVKTLYAARAAYQAALKEKKKYDRRKKKSDPEFELPEKPPDPDFYELATQKNMDAGAGLWHESEMPPGEWLVVYWYDFIGLVDKAHLLQAILKVEKPRTDIGRQRVPAGPAALRLNPEGNTFTLEFAVDEHLDPKKPQEPPSQQDSDRWALCEAQQKDWEGWPGKRPAKASWRFSVTVTVKEGALKEQGYE